TVSITSPSSGTSFTAPANMTITATASDSDGTVSKVDFYANGSLIGTANASPYSFSWNNVAAGSYSLTAIATDNQGAVTTSAPVSITVSNTPNSPFRGFRDVDVGDTGAAGSATETPDGTLTLRGAGADVWGTSDALHYPSTRLGADGGVTVQVTSVSDEANWVKAGIMIRASLDPSAAQAFILVSHAKGVAFQRRTSDGGSSVSTSGSTSTAPRWLKLE